MGQTHCIRLRKTFRQTTLHPSSSNKVTIIKMIDKRLILPLYSAHLNEWTWFSRQMHQQETKMPHKAQEVIPNIILILNLTPKLSIQAAAIIKLKNWLIMTIWTADCHQEPELLPSVWLIWQTARARDRPFTLRKYWMSVNRINQHNSNTLLWVVLRLV